MSFNLSMSPYAESLKSQHENAPKTPSVEVDQHRKPVPISSDPDFPTNVKSLGNVYLPRTNFDTAPGVGLKPLPERIEQMKDALEFAGRTPGARVTIEANGTFGPRGNEIFPALIGSPGNNGGPAVVGALAQIPEKDRPEISFLFGGGRAAPNTPLANVAIAEKNGSIGMHQQDGVMKNFVNWGNDKVFDQYRSEVADVIKTAGQHIVPPQKFGITVDDNFAVSTVPPSLMKEFIKRNNLENSENPLHSVQKIITGRVGTLADDIHRADGTFTLSLNGTIEQAKKMGLDPTMIGNKIDILEMQVYRPTVKDFRNVLKSALDELSDNVGKFPNMHELRIAVGTYASKHHLTKDEIIGQQKEIKVFEAQVNKLYESAGLTPPKVTTSLFPYGSFVK